VIGLGNPGPEYEWTPHNLGFHALERLVQDCERLFGPARVGPAPGFQTPTTLGAARPPAPCLVARCASHDAWLVKPLTFMNRSGAVVAPLARALRVPPSKLMVVYDDLDLEPGRLRIRPHGGSGGHNGVRSIVEALGSDAFPRLRIGVGRPRTDAARQVLSKLTGDELTTARIAVAEAAEALAAWLVEGDLERVMSRFHSRWKPMGE
jgi:PTH1 family peptidyl-tRNA hydrolase